MKRRRKGMYTIETKMRKWCYCASFAIVCIIYFVIGGLHAQRSVNANKINVDFSDPVVINSYDACRYPSFILDPEVTLEENVPFPTTVLDNDVNGEKNVLTEVTMPLTQNAIENISFDEALNIPVTEEAETSAIPALEYRAEDAPSTSQQLSSKPTPFVVKQEPKEPPQESRKMSRKTLPNKQRAAPYQRSQPAVSEISHEESQMSVQPVASVPRSNQQPRTPAQQQQNQQQPEQQQPRFIRVAPPARKPVSPHPSQQRRPAYPPPHAQPSPRVYQPRDVPPYATSPLAKTAPRQQVTPLPRPGPPQQQQLQQVPGQAPAAKRKAREPPVQSRAKTPRGGGGRSQPRALPQIGNMITVTKVVEPPAPPPPRQKPAPVTSTSRAELQRILQMRNLSVSINRT